LVVGVSAFSWVLAVGRRGDQSVLSRGLVPCWLLLELALEFSPACELEFGCCVWCGGVVLVLVVGCAGVSGGVRASEPASAGVVHRGVAKLV